jgi:hypothetical protein
VWFDSQTWPAAQSWLELQPGRQMPRLLQYSPEGHDCEVPQDTPTVQVFVCESQYAFIGQSASAEQCDGASAGGASAASLMGPSLTVLPPSPPQIGQPPSRALITPRAERVVIVPSLRMAASS